MLISITVLLCVCMAHPLCEHGYEQFKHSDRWYSCYSTFGIRDYFRSISPGQVALCCLSPWAGFGNAGNKCFFWECLQSFSAVRRIKAYLRTTMQEVRTNCMMVLPVHNCVERSKSALYRYRYGVIRVTASLERNWYDNTGKRSKTTSLSYKKILWAMC